MGEQALLPPMVSSPISSILFPFPAQGTLSAAYTEVQMQNQVPVSPS